jgi:Ca2+-binding RTX toxin-like protein
VTQSAAHIDPNDMNSPLDVEVIRGGSGNDILTAADGVNCSLVGNAGNDTLMAGAGRFAFGGRATTS